MECGKVGFTCSQFSLCQEEILFFYIFTWGENEISFLSAAKGSKKTGS